MDLFILNELLQGYGFHQVILDLPINLFKNWHSLPLAGWCFHPAATSGSNGLAGPQIAHSSSSSDSSSASASASTSACLSYSSAASSFFPLPDEPQLGGSK